jgi:hypothetical protein
MDKTPNLARDNHYVPAWYQKRFLFSGQTKLHYLDLNPKRVINSAGKTIELPSHHELLPENCFRHTDLYTTTFGGVPNDAIERYLFGDIDSKGAKAVRAFTSGDAGKRIRNFQAFFDFLDAQKLRTPKGLDWLKARYIQLNKNDLLLEMQRVRQRHCTMWVEAVREIVSAASSQVKFILSDHPVTVYNSGFPPSHQDCRYPNDPSVGRIGSQTIFPLDLNHCLILTNLEFAKNPDAIDVGAMRTNARTSGKTLVRTDTLIEGRELSDSDVLAINFILRARSVSYVAAAKYDWLFAEPSTHDWALLSPQRAKSQSSTARFSLDIKVENQAIRISLDDLQDAKRFTVGVCASGTDFTTSWQPKL